MRRDHGCDQSGQTQRLIQAAELPPQAPYLVDSIRLALNTGCRCGDLLELDWWRVDLSMELIHLEAGDTTSRRRRTVSLSATAREAMLSRARFRAMHCPATAWVFCEREENQMRSIKHSLGTVCRRAGIADFRIHDLRHCYPGKTPGFPGGLNEFDISGIRW